MNIKQKLNLLLNKQLLYSTFIEQALENMVKQIEETPEGTINTGFISEEVYRQFVKDYKEIWNNK